MPKHIQDKNPYKYLVAEGENYGVVANTNFGDRFPSVDILLGIPLQYTASLANELHMIPGFRKLDAAMQNHGFTLKESKVKQPYSSVTLAYRNTTGQPENAIKAAFDAALQEAEVQVLKVTIPTNKKGAVRD